MALRELSGMTWEEAAEAGRAGAVAVLPVGAVEAHGPHLPLGTDVIIAEAMARAGGERLAVSGRDVVLLPPLAYTAAPFAAGFAGTIPVSPATVTALVVDIARALAAHGFRVLAIANAHLDPAHLSALHAAVEEIRGVLERAPEAGSEPGSSAGARQAGVDGAAEPASPGGIGPRASGGFDVVFPDITRQPWGSRLTEEFRSGACHAGRYESSIVMAARPELVRDEIRALLPPVPVSLSAAIREGRRRFEEIGGDRAYFGYPAEATEAEGRSTIAVLGEILAEAVEAVLRGA